MVAKVSIEAKLFAVEAEKEKEIQKVQNKKAATEKERLLAAFKGELTEEPQSSPEQSETEAVEETDSDQEESVIEQDDSEQKEEESTVEQDDSEQKEEESAVEQEEQQADEAKEVE